MKRLHIFHFRTGTLLKQKCAVRFNMSTSLQCSLRQQADSALHILSGCQHKIISGMITERHNVARRLDMKAISKGSLAGCLVQLDAGSTDRLAQQNLESPEHANNRTIPSWLFNACLFARDRLTSFHPDAILDTPLPNKNTNYLSLLICTGCHTQDNAAEVYTEFRSSMSTRGRYTSFR